MFVDRVDAKGYLHLLMGFQLASPQELLKCVQLGGEKKTGSIDRQSFIHNRPLCGVGLNERASQMCVPISVTQTRACSEL